MFRRVISVLCAAVMCICAIPVAVSADDTAVSHSDTSYREISWSVPTVVGDSGGYPSFASAAAVILFAIVLTITCINLTVSRKHVHY